MMTWEQTVEKNPSLAVPHYLMAGWLYETGLESPLSDHQFDWLCKFIDKHWKKLDHYHKDKIDRDSLSSSTCSYLLGNYLPKRVKDAAYVWREDFIKIYSMEKNYDTSFQK